MISVGIRFRIVAIVCKNPPVPLLIDQMFRADGATAVVGSNWVIVHLVLHRDADLSHVAHECS